MKQCNMNVRELVKAPRLSLQVVTSIVEAIKIRGWNTNGRLEIL